MKRHLIAAGISILGAITTVVGTGWVASAQSPLQPVQYVYPDSTLEEIQQALDNGGTVYFDRLTRVTRQYGEYNQVARSQPDLPPSPADPAKGFNVGKYGKDVDIIGILGPNGERPRINGGTIVFRVGRFASLGFLGLPVSFKIENLEIFNPDLGSPAQVYSRVGIWVNLLGARTKINHCKITITGKDTDPGHAMNHSVAIWFYLLATQPQAPPSGAVIDITANTITGYGIHEGIHADSFWPVTPEFTPPRVFIGDNMVDVTKLGGFPNKLGTDGATIATAILLQGNVPNSIVANNRITGDARSPGVTPKVEAVGIGLAGSPGDSLSNVTVLGNDSSLYSADFQLWIQPIASDSRITSNSLGSATVAGVLCRGHSNQFVNNRFDGPYPGWPPSAGGPGLFWFTTASHANMVESTKLNGPPEGSDICDQVLDETGGANEIRGYERCSAP